MMDYLLHIGHDALTILAQNLKALDYSQVMVLVDEHTHQDCYPLLQPHLPVHERVEIPAGEIHKQLETCTHVWTRMTEAAFDRNSCLINLGGGVIGDLGGFVAGTYKRGIDFIQVPTTLLAQVDASVGGKLGVDFQGYKNHLGLFLDPQGVYIYPPFLKTLPEPELTSGFAEVIKHHLIADAAAWRLLRQTQALQDLDFSSLIRHSVAIKAAIVVRDPLEKGPRKALNYGHTIGHALETYRLNQGQALMHGEAIAMGMICENQIAARRNLISHAEQQEIEAFISQFFPPINLRPAETEAICALTLQDKKNTRGEIRCTLLNGIGSVLVDQVIEPDDIREALRYYTQL